VKYANITCRLLYMLRRMLYIPLTYAKHYRWRLLSFSIQSNVVCCRYWRVTLLLGTWTQLCI